MPAYANADGKVVVFFQDSGKFNYRYSTLGFQDAANLDDGDMWPVAYALDEVEPQGGEEGGPAGEGRRLLTSAGARPPRGRDAGSYLSARYFGAWRPTRSWPTASGRRWSRTSRP